MKPSIRSRTPHDMDGCVEALAAVQRVDRYPVDWPADPARWLTPADLVSAWVALDDEGVVGHVGLSRIPLASLGPALAQAVGASGELVGAVTRLFVTPRGRGHGLARDLLATVRKDAAARGLPLVLDVSDEGQAAVALYERAGWRRVASARARWLNSAGEHALVHSYVSPDVQNGLHGR
ncbi:GNAT family N-acetyltransferase [Nonomuraea sp. bgisy101]|uniref:GNAT family N-acetyltransferase n=1 Tax=Nonomuraea sp. bgisy101 TaxID=3413784 RepID=UPI003D7590FE